MPRIPKTLHYCFGYDQSFGGKPWSLVHFVCVKSAIERIKPDKAFIYYEYEPSGVWWEETKKILTPVKIQAPRQIFGNALDHPAHRTDVVRLELLIKYGGIYLDADVFVHESFDGLLDNSVVMGEEGVQAKIGLANAVILAEPDAPFLIKWHDQFRSFRSKGLDIHWNEHAVRIPSALSKAHPRELTILDHRAFFWPLHDELKLIFGSPSVPKVRGTYANHLWESVAWDDYLEYLTPGKVRQIDSNFHQWARPFLQTLPDEYGAPRLTTIFTRAMRKKITSEAAQLKSRLHRARQRGLSGSISYLLDEFSSRRRRRRTFSDIYKWKLWGGGTDVNFYSGVGSRGNAAVIYVDKMSELLNQHSAELGRAITIIDLGCGDFEIGRSLMARLGSANYIGCDIVSELIDHHSRTNTDRRVGFKVVDIVADDIPDGDVCLLRQVLQHLSNAEISTILRKLRTFRKVFITEAYPVHEVGPINPDKATGYDVRYDWQNGCGRGVELDKEPYLLSVKKLFRASGDSKDIIVTFELNG